jgi:GAF domain-containing protein
VEDPAGRFARLAVELHDAAMTGVAETAESLVQFAVQAIGGTSAALVLVRGGILQVAAVSDPQLESIYQVEFETGEGPLVTAFTYDTVVRVRDAAADPRWPLWGSLIVAGGMRSVLEVPLRGSDQTFGVLCLYSTERNAFGIDDEAVAQILARHATAAVATARSTEALGQAMDARKVVGQAMGILMERYQIDDDRAFAILRRYSQDTNTKLRDVAQLLIDTRKLPSVATPAEPAVKR